MPDAPRPADGAHAVGTVRPARPPARRRGRRRRRRRVLGDLVAMRDAPVGGQAVLEGVMMRGISTWAVAVRKPLPEQLKEGGLDAEEVPLGEIEVVSHPLTSRAQEAPRCCGCRSCAASSRSASRWASASRRWASAPTRSCPRTRRRSPAASGPARSSSRSLLAVGLFFVIPVGLTSLIKDQLDSSFLFWLVEGVLRTAIFLGYLLLLSRAARPAPRLRVPRRRAQDDLLLRGRPGRSRRRTPSASRACTRAAARASCSW